MIGWPALELQEAVKTAASVIIRTEIGSQSPWWIRSEYSLVNLQLPLRGLLVATIRQETPRSSSSGMDPRNRGRSRKIIMLHLSLFFSPSHPALDRLSWYSSPEIQHPPFISLLHYCHKLWSCSDRWPIVSLIARSSTSLPPANYVMQLPFSQLNLR